MVLHNICVAHNIPEIVFDSDDNHIDFVMLQKGIHEGMEDEIVYGRINPELGKGRRTR